MHPEDISGEQVDSTAPLFAPPLALEAMGTAPREKKRNALWLLFFVYYAFGFCTALATQAGPSTQIVVQLVLSLVAQIVIIYWFIVDAQEHNYTISKTLFLMFVALTFLATPYYFVKTRGTKALAPILLSLILLLFFMLSAGVGEWIGQQMPGLVQRIGAGRVN